MNTSHTPGKVLISNTCKPDIIQTMATDKEKLQVSLLQNKYRRTEWDEHYLTGVGQGRDKEEIEDNWVVIEKFAWGSVAVLTVLVIVGMLSWVF